MFRHEVLYATFCFGVDKYVSENSSVTWRPLGNCVDVRGVSVDQMVTSRDVMKENGRAESWIIACLESVQRSEPLVSEAGRY